MRKVIGLTLAMITVLAVFAPVPARAAAEGSIAGVVINKTPGSAPFGAGEVNLLTYTGGTTVSDRKKTTTDAAGKFKFEGLSVDPGVAYVVSSTFQDVEYKSPVIVLAADQPAQTVELSVYDTTASDENIQVTNGHMVVFLHQGGMEVLEVWRFSNTGSKTFVGKTEKSGRAVMRFTLPAGATSLSPGQGPAVVAAEGGAVTSVPLPPGFVDINFTYVVPFDGSSTAITRKTDYQVASFRMLVEDIGAQVTSAILTPATPQTINGQNYLELRATNLAKGTDLDAAFSGIEHPADVPPEDPIPWPWLLGGAGLLAAIAIVVYPQLRKRQMLAGAPAGPVSAPPPVDDEEDLLQQLAGLDDDYQAGNLDEKKYQLRRVQLKARLKKVYGRSTG